MLIEANVLPLSQTANNDIYLLLVVKDRVTFVKCICKRLFHETLFDAEFVWMMML